jgi:membrane protein
VPIARHAKAEPSRGGGSELRALRTRVKESFPGRCLTSFADLQGLDRAMGIASQSFTALIPLLILVSAVLPASSGNVVADSIIRRFDLTGDAARSVEIVFAQSEPSSVGLGSLLLLLLSGISLTRRLQRMYLEAYGLAPLPGVRGSFNAALGLAVILVEIALLYFLRTLVRALPFDWVLGVPLTVLAGLVLWTSVPFLLLDRRITWQRLLPAGALAGTAVSLYGVATTFYMPRLMTSYSQRYGLFGVTVALVGWLLCIAIIVVAATVVAAEFDRAPDPWARRLRAKLGAEVSHPEDDGPADEPRAPSGVG